MVAVEKGILLLQHLLMVAVNCTAFFAVTGKYVAGFVASIRKYLCMYFHGSSSRLPHLNVLINSKRRAAYFICLKLFDGTSIKTIKHTSSLPQLIIMFSNLS